jgi:hypothetical protein
MDRSFRISGKVPAGRDVFELVFTSEPIIDDEDGQECAMRIDYERKYIILSERVPPHLRPQTVAVAVNEIWRKMMSPVPVLSVVS